MNADVPSVAEALPEHNWTLARTMLATLVVAGVVFLFWLGYLFQTVLFLLFIAIVLATALAPAVNLVRRFVRSPVVANIIVYCAFLLLLSTTAVVVVPLVVDQVVQALTGLPATYESVRAQLLKTPSALVTRVANWLPETLPSRSEPAPNQPSGSSHTITTLVEAWNYSRMLIRGVFFTLATVLFAFYWSLLNERSLRALLLFLRPEHRVTAREVIDGIQAKVGAYLRGQAILCLVVGSLSFIAYWFIGLPYVTLLAVGAGVLEAVPMFGPVLGAIAPALLAMSIDPSKVLWVLAATFVIQQTENYLLVPRVMDRSVGISAIVTLLSIAGFSALFGVLGAVLAIPLAAIVQFLLARFLLSPEALEPKLGPRRDHVSLVRYEAQQFIQDMRMQVRNKSDVATRRNDAVEETMELLAVEIERQLAQQDAATAIAGEALV